MKVAGSAGGTVQMVDRRKNFQPLTRVPVMGLAEKEDFLAFIPCEVIEWALSEAPALLPGFHCIMPKGLSRSSS